MKIEQLHGITALTVNDKTMTGKLAEQVSVERIQEIIDGIRYPLPDLTVYTLPFALDKINDVYYGADGIAFSDRREIYIGALVPGDYVTPDWAYKAVAKYLAHEIGHIVHFSYLPVLGLGPAEGTWCNFEAILQHTFANNTYNTSAHEAFAECWRLMFAPDTRWAEHRQGLNWQAEGLREWMLSLNGDLVLRPDHAKAYHGGLVYPLDVAPYIQSDRTMVPLRFISERLGHQVDWDGESIVIR